MFAFRLWLPGLAPTAEAFPSCSTLRSQGAEEASARERGASDDAGCTAMLPSTEKKGASLVAICRQKSNSTATSKAAQDHRPERDISSAIHHYFHWWPTVFSDACARSQRAACQCVARRLPVVAAARPALLFPPTQMVSLFSLQLIKQGQPPSVGVPRTCLV